jgi:hypothetical protein
MADDVFTSLASDEPDRGDEVEEESFDVPISASQAENMSPNDSDLESTLKRLFPFCDSEDIQRVARFIMLGRVFPDNFSTKYILSSRHLR